MKNLVKILSIVVLCLSAGFSARSVERGLGVFHRGADSLVYTGYAPLADKPVTLYYYIPTKGNIKNMPVLITFHGADRHGNLPRDNWKDFAERDGFIVLCPEFSKELYNENAYQFGNVFKDRNSTELNPEELWTYSIVEPIFDFFQDETGNRVSAYSIQGHSAGGQFTHRYLIAKPDARVDVAVASNPGSWTWVSKDGKIGESEDSFTWPYTLKGTPFADDRHIEAYLKRDMTVHLGDADTLRTGPNVPKGPAALAEGAYRYERGRNYFEASKEYARNSGLGFGWNMVVVKGVGHRGKGMVYARSHRDENGKRQYDISQIRQTGAYWIIYGNQ